MTTVITSADSERSIILSGTSEYQLSSNYIGKPPISSTFFHLHVASLSIAAPTVTINPCGENGVTNINANDKSANAASAWPVLVSCHQLDEISKLHIKSRGGDGGGGFVPSDGNSPPGIGGDAGNGAEIRAWFECLVDTLGDLGEAALTSTDAAEQLAMTEEFVEGAKTLTLPGEVDGISWLLNVKVDPEAADWDASSHTNMPDVLNVKSILKMLPNLINSVRRPSTSWVTVWPDYVTKDYRGGTPGKGSWCRNSQGDIHTGADGAPGKDGSLVHNRMHTAAIRTSNECFIHPDQVALTLRDVENNYFIGSKQSLDIAQTTLKMLQARLAFSAELVPEDNLYKAYLSKESTVLSVVRGANSMVPTSVLGIASSLDLSNRYMARLGLGVDFYRHQLTWALADFQSIESDYEDYAQMAADNKQQSDQIGIGKNAAGQGLKLATSDLTTLAVELAESADHIAVMQGEIPIKRGALDDELDHIVSDIKSSFKFSFKDLLSAVSTMCFSPSLAIGAAQGVIQTATLLNGSAIQVKNDAGDAVSKDYVVEKVYALKAGLDGLQEHVELSADDPTLTTNDPNGNKLIGNETDIMDLINQYRGTE
ncbi:hypothetical protein LTR01_006144 [Friedmanniomyces endolithicus]|nr:hypothetical protein LTR01_006144 [Friedmanniomyces endolithicus]KAK0834031.1 hypothetical protein LTR73_001794 [Friedmanniomyces endolithicus]